MGFKEDGCTGNFTCFIYHQGTVVPEKCISKKTAVRGCNGWFNTLLPQTACFSRIIHNVSNVEKKNCLHDMIFNDCTY